MQSRNGGLNLSKLVENAEALQAHPAIPYCFLSILYVY